MSNPIDEALKRLKESEGMSVREFAERCGLPMQTVYTARNKKDVSKISVDTFLKIAHGLGMTAEELYYGTERETAYQDDRQRRINVIYESVNESYRQHMWESAELCLQASSKSAEPLLLQEAK